MKRPKPRGRICLSRDNLQTTPYHPDQFLLHIVDFVTVLCSSTIRAVLASPCVPYILVRPARISSLKVGLMDRKRMRQLCPVRLRGAPSALPSARRTRIRSQPQQTLSQQRPHRSAQLVFGGVQILRVARVQQPHRLASAQHPGQPVEFRREVRSGAAPPWCR